MSTPRAVVIPFGVPSEGRGLGIGLAALVHACVHVEGGGVALAQLQSRKSEEQDLPSATPVEAFVPPTAWRDIARRGEPQSGVGVVLTGSFEPPTEGHGTIRMLAFDSRDGRTCARVDAPIDDEHAGAGLVGALERLCSGLGGEIGAVRGLRELRWESLESVLRAERCALHDPQRGGPHDRLAAMMHFGRAIEDAPAARYPVERLTWIALEGAQGGAVDPKLTAATVRALERALEDAPTHLELGETLAALLLRTGRPGEAERRMNAAVAAAPKRCRPYTLLSHALRAQGKFDGAQAAVDAGFAECGNDVALHTERGVILAERGDVDGARSAWQEALAREPANPIAFGLLAGLVLRERDASAAQTLIDAALASPRAHPDVLRRAVQLAQSTETEGLARAARIARLCERILEGLPDDASALLALARALVVLGDPAGARARLAQVDRVAPESEAGAEAQITRLALEAPAAERDLQRVLQAAHDGVDAEMTDVVARARRLATLHNAWPGWVAAGIAERRRGRWAAARAALEVALETAPGATLAHLELAVVLLEMDDAPRALAHADRALALSGDSSLAIRLRARALAALERKEEALGVLSRAMIAFPQDEHIRDLVDFMRWGQRRAAAGWRARLREAWGRWKSWAP
ncbi:MAG TPA: tetratricopeptide repeat protein [Polyangiaceae bacterium]|jgi:predicted Zn-dependent protease|nr:tetratricopeptide repeat protein [Polyangiaceae bacterium]